MSNPGTFYASRVTMEQPRHGDFETLRDGLIHAVDRFSAAPAARPESFHAMLEILAWAGAIRDRLRDDAPPVLEGLYYTRNIVIHQGADVVDVIVTHSTFGEGTFGEAVFGGQPVRRQTWPAREEMPTPRSRAGLQEYDDHVAGREIPEVLQELTTSLGRE
jgi:hypothetical protein